MAEQVKLGRLLDETAQRDAVHVAIAPVVAGAKLFPGKGVGFEAGSTERVQHYGTTIGIVDPFLTEPVEPGQRCWMFLYPNTITSLRHDWTHPAFETSAAVPDEAASRKWIDEYAVNFDVTGERLIEIAREYLTFGSYVTEYGSDGWRDEFYETGDEFWKHYEIVTGEKVAEDDRGSPFSCSC